MSGPREETKVRQKYNKYLSNVNYILFIKENRRFYNSSFR